MLAVVQMGEGETGGGESGRPQVKVKPTSGAGGRHSPWKGFPFIGIHLMMDDVTSGIDVF